MKIEVTRDEFALIVGHCELIGKGDQCASGRVMHCESCVLYRICAGQCVAELVTKIIMPDAD